MFVKSYNMLYYRKSDESNATRYFQMTDVYSISDAHNVLCNCDSNKNFNLLKILRHIDYIIGSQMKATQRVIFK